MTPSSSTPAIEPYWQYVHDNCPELTIHSIINLATDLESVSWDEPTTAIELNNLAVLALIEAEQSDSPELRAINLEMAIDALQRGVALNQHPLCAAHLAIAQCMLGDREAAAHSAYSQLISTLQPLFNSVDRLPLGLVYLPLQWRNLAIARQEQFHQLLHVEDGYNQAILLFIEVLCQAQVVFYNTVGLRFLQLASQLSPQTAYVNFKLGLASLIQQQWEGLLYLQRARKLAFDHPAVLQAMYLAYREPEHPKAGEYWLNLARNHAQRHPEANVWKWAQLPAESPMTYVPFEQMALAVEPNLRSIVTSVLLAEGDWFEAEMEFWREQIEPGMTVIDVGANVGVYTFSAAQRVGATGRVLAVEPFSGCVRCLQETCKTNDLPWVTVCAGAASDRNTTLRLSLRSASELNRVVTADEELETSEFEEIPCFTLDHLIERENLSRVDWLKIDAEGHELQVLQGSDRLLTDFAPKILYENVAGLSAEDEDASNTIVAEYLMSKGYQLFRYRPFVKELIPIDSIHELRGNLNIVALPKA
ncbi:FkbM family methyltransferase [Oscillatoria sp. FACHB-1407]|uniref:FkbM family methyltransferase n=1 Tax=Oscillatoria sp. FACHB-1407 TaxID=2692847 RepID=UPI001689BF18|nr:FkbM family methyltransferase [Oscillatoria sp. FACHB-1407]MBD2462314.1 FkbM family methyltransferase [Oscillatoria sp. FACHB-1407]